MRLHLSITTERDKLWLWYEDKTLKRYELPYKKSFAIIVAIDDYNRSSDPMRRGQTGYRPLSGHPLA